MGRSAVLKYVCGRNMPGYLPDNEPQEIEGLNAAMETLVDDLRFEQGTYEDGASPWESVIAEAQEDLDTAKGAPLEYKGPDGMVYFLYVAPEEEP